MRGRAVAAAWAVALAEAIAGCNGGPRAPDVPVVQVKKQAFARTIDTEGYLRPVKATPITLPSDVDMSLRVLWLAPDGSPVKKGDVVARFDDSELKSRLANAEADRATATARRQKEAVLLDATRSDRQRATGSATRELEMTRAFQRRDNEIFSRDAIIEADIDEKLQTVKADHAQRAEVVDKRVARSKLQMIDVDARKADEAIKRSHDGLGALEIRAPHDGLLMLKRTWRGDTVKVGDMMWRGMPVAEVPLIDQMEVEVFVLEAEAAGLGKGKAAEVIIEARPDKPFKAKIKRVETVAKRRSYKSPTQYFGVVLELEHTDRELMKPGQRVRARLFLHAQEALVVPRPALFDKEGKWVAYRRDKDVFLAVQVKLGPSTAGLVTIESGLKENDVIALRDPAQSVEDILGAGSQSARAR